MDHTPAEPRPDVSVTVGDTVHFFPSPGLGWVREPEGPFAAIVLGRDEEYPDRVVLRVLDPRSPNRDLHGSYPFDPLGAPGSWRPRPVPIPR